MSTTTASSPTKGPHPEELVEPHPPGTNLVAGYTLPNQTAVRLGRVLQGHDPLESCVPEPEPTTPEYILPPKVPQFIPEICVINESVIKYVAPRESENGVGVDVMLDFINDRYGIIIVTQGCFVPHGSSGPEPVATEGEREELVRQWLEDNGMFSSCTPLDVRSHVVHRHRQERLRVGDP